jgi:hypothetical protein
VLNWAKDVLVGRDPNERDAPTQAAIAAWPEGETYDT